jgi:hypothetical protein
MSVERAFHNEGHEDHEDFSIRSYQFAVVSVQQSTKDRAELVLLLTTES